MFRELRLCNLYRYTVTYSSLLIHLHYLYTFMKNQLAGA